MNAKLFIGSACFTLLCNLGSAQLLQTNKSFTRQDTLRGSLNAERNSWDVQQYHVQVKPDFSSKTITGVTRIVYKAISPIYTMQVDLQQPLIIDSILHRNKTVAFVREGNVAHVKLIDSAIRIRFKPGVTDSITVYYHGKPREAVRPPWDGGWIWRKDDQGRPWMSVACQGLGASVWYPCKDHQSDEPDQGASLTMIVPDTLVAVGNGRLASNTTANGLATYTWKVKNPINSYNIIPYIGKYVSWKDTLNGENGKLDLQYWVLDYEKAKAEKQFAQVKPMLRAFEYWMGPYPFYADGYQLVQSPHLGMEHQSAIAYGNKFLNGYLGRDLSGTGWGLKWDFIIVHESGHEWFANNITTKDIADMWVHEGFTNYSETLFIDYYHGNEAGNDYNKGIRKNIANDKNIIGIYGVNEEGSGDMYYKASNMIHSIRHIINDDNRFRNMIRGLNKDFYHSTVTTEQVEQYISKAAGINLSKVFDQYLRTTQIPVLEYEWNADSTRLAYRWNNCIAGFDMPLSLGYIKLQPNTQWQSIVVDADKRPWLHKDYIERMYYIKTASATKP